jgi:hypothetical protein
MYLGTNRINYFLIEMHELAEIPNLSTPTHFNIYTNRKNRVSHQMKHISTSVTPNVKYVISKFLMAFFTTHRHIIPKATFHRVFPRLQSLLLTKYESIYNRYSSTKNSNKRTKTFIKFSWKKRITYLGFYLACDSNCNLPAAYVMSRDRWRCGAHEASLYPPPRLPVSSCPTPDCGPKHFHHRLLLSKLHQKQLITSRRLGVTYSKVFRETDLNKFSYHGPIADIWKYCCAYRCEQIIPNPSKQQLQRRLRHSRISQHFSGLGSKKKFLLTTDNHPLQHYTKSVKHIHLGESQFVLDNPFSTKRERVVHRSHFTYPVDVSTTQNDLLKNEAWYAMNVYYYPHLTNGEHEYSCANFMDYCITNNQFNTLNNELLALEAMHPVADAPVLEFYHKLKRPYKIRRLFNKIDTLLSHRVDCGGYLPRQVSLSYRSYEASIRPYTKPISFDCNINKRSLDLGFRSIQSIFQVGVKRVRLLPPVIEKSVNTNILQGFTPIIPLTDNTYLPPPKITPTTLPPPPLADPSASLIGSLDFSSLIGRFDSI